LGIKVRYVAGLSRVDHEERRLQPSLACPSSQGSAGRTSGRHYGRGIEKDAVPLVLARPIIDRQALARRRLIHPHLYLILARRSVNGDLNADFHRSLGLLAGNQRLADQISKVLDQLTRVFHLGLDLRDSTDEMRDEHLMLAQALSDRDPDRAEQIAQAQISRSQQRVLEALTDSLLGGAVGGLRSIQIEPTGCAGTLYTD